MAVGHFVDGRWASLTCLELSSGAINTVSRLHSLYRAGGCLHAQAGHNSPAAHAPAARAVAELSVEEGTRREHRGLCVGCFRERSSWPHTQQTYIYPTFITPQWHHPPASCYGRGAVQTSASYYPVCKERPSPTYLRSALQHHTLCHPWRQLTPKCKLQP